MDKRGVLLINVGSPPEPTEEAVANYLREFLMDSDIIELPWIIRWPLVNALIVPKRAAASAQAYKSIWSPRGSPLVANTRALAYALQKEMGAEYIVGVGMRYGTLSIESELKRQIFGAGVRDLTVVPLFPQFARATTDSGRKEVLRVIGANSLQVNLRFVRPFHGDQGYLDALAAHTKDFLKNQKHDYLLFSFHGLPKSARGSALYQEQCLETAQAVADRMGLSTADFGISFQSRLGRGRWLEPATDQVLRELAGRGVKHLAVACPSFVADCLENLEEIGIRGKETFRSAGGKELILVPSLNENDLWVKALSTLVRNARLSHGGIP
jgi:protoporphyrin/coproporphyrin ferrochelatase